jgi:hypothetical protein
MRKLGIAAVLFIAISTPIVIDAGVARRQYCEDYYREVFLAARQAVRNVGARIIHADDAGGSIVGRLEAELYGHAIEISVWINRNRDSQGGVEPMWVQVSAKFRKMKDKDLDEEQKEQLVLIENSVMELIRLGADCGPPDSQR